MDIEADSAEEATQRVESEDRVGECNEGGGDCDGRGVHDAGGGDGDGQWVGNGGSGASPTSCRTKQSPRPSSTSKKTNR